MLVAILAAIVTLVAVVAVAVAVLVARDRARTSNVSVKKDVRSISSVGVSSSLGESTGGAAPRAAGRSGAPARSTVNPADGLKSRFVAMGVFAAAVFGTLSAKLWVMQILESEEFGSASEANRYATVRKPAPRGLICDADGLPLVKNRASLTVLADPDVADDRDVVLRLSALLGVPYHVVRQRIQDASSGAQSQRVVASDARLRDAAFIAEHSDAFPGVEVEERSVRDYPYGALAAHVLGYTGTVTEGDLASVGEGREIELDDVVGRAGVEQYYDDLLAGDHGERKVVADADGNIVEVVSEVQPSKGSDVRLSLKGPVQYVCDRALAALIAPEDGTIGTGTGVAGAVVVMDLSDGGIVAMASYPTFDPAVFEGVVSQETWDLYQSAETWNPLMNRVIGGQYPAASTYKTFTGLAALESGFASASSSWNCTGSWDGWGSGEEKLCWDHGGHGTLDLRGGIVQSCDTVFYDIGKQFWDNRERAGQNALQDFLAKYPLESPTGIDLAGEAVGRIPTPEWKAENYRDYPESAAWVGGDTVNMCIGQGYVLVTPIELAVSYGAVATGKVLKPHVLKDVRNAEGEAVRTFEPEVVDEPDVSPEHLAYVREALNGVATDNADVSGTLERFGIDPAVVACKTGTAEYTDDGDTGWFACYAPVSDPKYVVACVVEHGGGGSAAAAPLGAEVLAAVLSYDAGTLDEMGKIAGSTGRALPDASKRAMTGRTD
ncbi:penicillin-binding protein 2 [Gordonibacter sp. An230]|uniref:penicillin-binding protein 2 n=1 Tax=Gordonibacter sp. An230 TaxID=1965592 RepID=UPI000B3914AF|nr:penicillin-binding protein 2 [Gordonibacter sp. An230]OUO90859.1 penicillin-binding protein 2 [Gordonibacter sp. An230]